MAAPAQGVWAGTKYGAKGGGGGADWAPVPKKPGLGGNTNGEWDPAVFLWFIP